MGGSSLEDLVGKSITGEPIRRHSSPAVSVNDALRELAREGADIYAACYPGSSKADPWDALRESAYERDDSTGSIKSGETAVVPLQQTEWHSQARERLRQLRHTSAVVPNHPYRPARRKIHTMPNIPNYSLFSDTVTEQFKAHPYSADALASKRYTLPIGKKSAPPEYAGAPPVLKELGGTRSRGGREALPIGRPPNPNAAHIPTSLFGTSKVLRFEGQGKHHVHQRNKPYRPNDKPHAQPSSSTATLPQTRNASDSSRLLIHSEPRAYDQNQSESDSLFLDDSGIEFFEPSSKDGGALSRLSPDSTFQDDMDSTYPSSDTESHASLHNVTDDMTPRAAQRHLESSKNSSMESFLDMDSDTEDPFSPTFAEVEVKEVSNLSSRIQEIKGPLRCGGFCDIFLGQLRHENQPETVEQVAMKMLRVFNVGAQISKAKKKFRREVDIWRSLRHPNVLRFYGTCELEENRLYMVSPWVKDGNTLEYLRKNPTANRRKLLAQTASALQYLHSGQDVPQIVHGDLKADNVLISATGDALLCDFGLSRYAEEAMRGTSSTIFGGHIRFMAPELIASPKDTSHPTRPTPSSDVFAFASLALQIYTEKAPFSDLSEVQAMFKIVNGELPPRPVDDVTVGRGLTDDIWTLMTDCWRSNAGDRPCMEEVANRMGSIDAVEVAV